MQQEGEGTLPHDNGQFLSDFFFKGTLGRNQGLRSPLIHQVIDLLLPKKSQTIVRRPLLF
jgi:hypothetical protein